MLILSSQIASQTSNKPLKALKFDEINSDWRKSVIEERASRFARQLKKNLTSKAYIIFYNSRLNRDFVTRNGEYWVNETYYQLLYKDHISEGRIIKAYGGIKEYSSIEYWIVPKRASPPETEPEFDKSDAIICPSINIYPRDYYFDNRVPLQIGVEVSPKDQVITDFEWKVSAGTISEGQGTTEIKVDVSKVSGTRTTISVQLGGLSLECDDKAMRVIEFGNSARLSDSFEYTNISLFKAIGDSYTAVLYARPDLKGHIIVYEKRDGRESIAPSLVKGIKDYLITNRGILPERITVIDGGFREKTFIEMWLMPQDVSPPKPRPTVDRTFIKKRKPKRIFWNWVNQSSKCPFDSIADWHGAQ